jgi:hypothetical protein
MHWTIGCSIRFLAISAGVLFCRVGHFDCESAARQLHASEPLLRVQQSIFARELRDSRMYDSLR